MSQPGDNSDKLLKSYTTRITDLMSQIGDLKGEVKQELQAAKTAGLDIKALLKVAKELAMDSGQREKQLQFEFALHDYRKAVGLPTEIADEAKVASHQPEVAA